MAVCVMAHICGRWCKGPCLSLHDGCY